MKQKISTVAIFDILGEICIQRGYDKPRTYKKSWRRAALLRNVILMGYQYRAFETIAVERYTIGKPITGRYH